MSVSTSSHSGTLAFRPPPRRKAVLEMAPMMPAAVGLAAGVAIDRYVWSGSTQLWSCLILIAVVLGLVENLFGGKTFVAILLGWAAIGGAWHHARWFDRPADDISLMFESNAAAVPAWLRAVVVEPPIYRADPERPDGTGSTRTVVAVTGLCDGRVWQTVSGRVAVWVGGDRTDLVPGRPVQLAGSLGPIEGPLNPGERDARAWWRTDGVRVRLVAGSVEGVWPNPDGETWPWAYRLGRIRDWSNRRLVASLNPSVAPLASALLLGRREMVDPELNDAFARTGTTHLLAISGLHMQVLAAMLWAVCRSLGLGRQKTMWLVIVCSTGYAILVGLAPSVVRSLAMTLVGCLAGLLDRRSRFANLMAIALIVTLALNPAHLFDAGCQLSFLAVAAILWAVPPVLRWIKSFSTPLDLVEKQYLPLWRKQLSAVVAFLVEGIIISLVVWVLAWPLVLQRFHINSPISILLNLPLVPITSLAMLLAGLTLALATIWPPLSLLTALGCRFLLGVTGTMVTWGAKQRWAYGFGPGPGVKWVCLFYGVLGIAAMVSLNVWPKWARRGAWGLVAGCAIFVLARSWLPNEPGTPWAEVIAVGHGLAIVVQSGDGHTLLYDAGKMGDPRVGRRVIAPALWELGISRLDCVVLSHADADHYNGLPDLIDRFAIGEVVTAPNFAGTSNPNAEALLETIKTAGIPVRTAVKGSHWKLGRDVGISALHPPEGMSAGASDNARSLVLEVEAVGRRFVLTGDLEAGGLTAVTGLPQLPIDVFLSPHHAGRSSNPTYLYQWAKPKLVVSSQRKPVDGNRDSLEPVEKAGIPVWRTWNRGAIRLRWMPDGIAASGYLDPNSPDPERTSETMELSQIFVYLTNSPAIVAIAGLLLGLLGVISLAVIEFGAWILVMPRRSLKLPADDPYPGEPIHTTAPDGTRLAGTWHGHPDANGRTLLLLHGLAEQRQTMRARADGIFARGWNVAVLDARGYGESGGALASFGGREVADLYAWVNTIVARVGPSLTLAVWGRSMGAGVALRAASEDDRIKALVLEAPYIDLHKTAATLLRRYRIPASHSFAALVLRRARKLTGVSLHHPRPIDVAPRVAVPTMILRGTHDALISQAETTKLGETIAGPVEHVEIEGARHSKVLDIGGPELIAKVGAFLDKINTLATIPAD